MTLLILETVIIFLFLWFLFFIPYHFFVTYKGKLSRSEKSVKKKEHSKIYKLLFVVPRLIARDLSAYNPDVFKEQGLILFEGAQGSGKTIAMTQFCQHLKNKYPKIKIMTNYGLSFEDDNLNSWEPIVGDINGYSGLIACFDEISIWFSNRNYANFPPELLRTITQNRKEHRLILGTCQLVSMVDKQIRRQCTMICKCRSFGFFTVVWRFRPVLNSEGDIIKMLPINIYAFLQTDELRNLYDTFRIVENLKKIGFQERRDL